MSIRVLHGDCLDVLPTLAAGSVQCCVTSPPYFGLRDYGVAGQIGMEPTPDAYVAAMVAVFAAVRRVLRDDGVVFLNLGDSYSGGKTGRTDQDSMPRPKGGHREQSGPSTGTQRQVPDGYKIKDLLMIPARVALALQADGWFLRADIIWHKPNPMPESVTDRPTSAHEHVFLLTKNARYFYDADAVREENSNPEAPECVKHWRDRPGNGEWPSGTGGRMGSVQNGRNLRNVWTIATQPFSGAHFATMPPSLAERCIRAGSKPGDTILDPFSGAGTTAMVADRLGRNGIGIELNPAFAAMAVDRVTMDAGMFAEIVDAPVPQPPEDARLDLFAPGAV